MLKIPNLIISIFIMFTLTPFLQAQDVSAYFTAPYNSVEEVQSKLSHEGFEILTSYSPAKKDYLNVIVFTSKELKTLGSTDKRGFISIQRVLINTKAKTLRLTNPDYWLRAFMQKSFDEKEAKRLTDSFVKVFGKLESTKDVLDKDAISNYHFAISMPYYEDMTVIKEGKELLSKINKKKKLFEVQLSNGSTLVGVKMSKSSEKFIETIGEENAISLPYIMLIEDGKAYALAPKYYLAVSYPLLSLGEFMKISSSPDAIVRKLKKVFK